MKTSMNLFMFFMLLIITGCVSSKGNTSTSEDTTKAILKTEGEWAREKWARINAGLANYPIKRQFRELPGGGEYLSIPVPEELINIRIDNTISYQDEFSFFHPSVPIDVTIDIYAKLYDIHKKTILAGKYCFDPAFLTHDTHIQVAKDGKETLISSFNESSLADDFTFIGECIEYVDYFLFLVKQDKILIELYNRGIITWNTKFDGSYETDRIWIEYRTEKNKYIIDPAWSDWDSVGELNKTNQRKTREVRFEEAIKISPYKNELIEASIREYFFTPIARYKSTYEIYGMVLSPN